jgi:hypothetical protein
MTTYTIEIVEETVKATFETDVKAKLEDGWTAISQLIITDDGVTRTYAQMFQTVNDVT